MALAVSVLVPMTAFAADDESPGDVENVHGDSLNGAALITWEVASDNEAVAGYQVHYGLSAVTEVGQTFDDMVDAGDVLEYTVSDLDNGKEYFFSVIAYDAAGNEGINWSPQVAVTPTEDASEPTDGEAPTVVDAEATHKYEVKIEFSEAVVLPEEDGIDAFAIENDETFEALEVTEVRMDEEDEDNKTVILVTAEQVAGDDYTLTVGIDIEDMTGNQIVSGTSDTAIFVGSNLEPEQEEPVEDISLPKVISVGSTDSTHVLVTFNKTITLSIDPSLDFIISAKDDSSKTLEILGVELVDSIDGVMDGAAIVTTSVQEDIQYNITVINVIDDDDNEIIAEDGTMVFRGIEGVVETPEDPEDPTENPLEDLLAPEDVANFLATKVLQADRYMVRLTWQKVQEANTDAVKQTLYTSRDSSNYSEIAELDADATDYEVQNLAAGDYWFKLTQTDAAGNESDGEVIKVVLSETGPEMAGLLFLSLGAGRLFRRKRQ